MTTFERKWRLLQLLEPLSLRKIVVFFLIKYARFFDLSKSFED